MIRNQYQEYIEILVNLGISKDNVLKMRQMDYHSTIVNLLGHLCQECEATEQLEIHHIIPISAGGTNELFNIKILCKFCHCKTWSGHSKEVLAREVICPRCKEPGFIYAGQRKLIDGRIITWCTINHKDENGALVTHALDKGYQQMLDKNSQQKLESLIEQSATNNSY